MSTTLVIKHARQLVRVATQGERCKAGDAARHLEVIEDGAIVCENDRISWVGTTYSLPPTPPTVVVLDATDKIVLPGLVDSHTHLVFAGDRADEFEQRLQGVPYATIAAQGGGINNTVRHVRAASKETLKHLARRRLERMLDFGITTVEVKSGYGLSLHDEIKCLEVIAELGQELPSTLVPTFLGAHEVPLEFRQDRNGYLRILLEEMLPEVARSHLASFCDVFCEQGVFDVAESERILRRAIELGLRTKVHADEFTPLGGAELAARMGAVSADHLLNVTDRGMDALREAGTIATLLPGTAFFLGLPYAPARRLIERGLPVAIASDCNPGSCMTENLPLVGTMACTQMKMLPAEALVAMTLNGAAAVGMSDRVGSIEVGKQADLVICDVPGYQHLTYHYGVNHVWKVVKSGRVVVDHGARAGQPLSSPQ